MADPKNVVKLARAYGLAAEADGWERTENYKGEHVDQACRLTREGFLMTICSRDDGYASVNIWGSDKLVIKPPETYNWEKIKAGLLHCNLCDASGVATERYSFAGRCCKKCLTAAQKEHEYPGWTN